MGEGVCVRAGEGGRMAKKKVRGSERGRREGSGNGRVVLFGVVLVVYAMMGSGVGRGKGKGPAWLLPRPCACGIVSAQVRICGSMMF